MPLYSENKMFPSAKPWPFHPCYATDALGRNIGDCVAINTDSGECWKVVLGSDGKPTIDHARRVVKTLLIVAPVPIRFTPEKVGR